MSLNKVISLADCIMPRNSINFNSKYDPQFITELKKIFRICLYLYVIFEENLSIDSSLIDKKKDNKKKDDNNKDDNNKDDNNKDERSNSKFQVNDFRNSFKNFCKKQEDSEIEELTIKYIFNKIFSKKLTVNDIQEIFKEFSNQECGKLLDEKPFSGSSCDRSFFDDLSDISKVKIKVEIKKENISSISDENLLNIVEKKYKLKQRSKGSTEIKLLRKNFTHNRSNPPYYDLMLEIFKKVCKHKFNSINSDDLENAQIETWVKESVKVYFETINIYDHFFDPDKKSKSFNHIGLKNKIDQFNKEYTQDKDKKTYLLKSLKFGEDQLDKLINDLFSTSSSTEKKDYFKQTFLDIKKFEHDLGLEEKEYQDLKFLEELDIIKSDKYYGISEKIKSLSWVQILEKILKMSPLHEINNGTDNTNLYDFLNNMKFDTRLSTTSEMFQNKQRFFIKFQHMISEDDMNKVGNIIYELRIVWENDEIPLIKIKYASSSQKGKEKDLVIFPVCLFYNQRGIYLTGYGPKPGDNYVEHYNYRLDHFQEWEKNNYIIPLEWDESNEEILPQLLNNKEELQKHNSDYIYPKLQEALGVDLHRDIKTMLLRFPHDFHKYYIENTNRHETFKPLPLDVENLENFWRKFEEETKTKLKEDDKELITQVIKQVIKKYPNDAYYVMNYRHGKEGGNDVEADVIMRLRSWGHNVEILAPEDLRKRMKKDSEKLWDIYKNDK